ncbi:hypothetical protein ACFT5C_21410 [Streptomyces sp. NPDC057116]|uniref:hypothetical protein n=1 Tax=Streptomyces sp. NPDC057116 TaxID=3346023 RepID=UPI00362BB382
MPLEAFSRGNARLVRGGVKGLKLKKRDSRDPPPSPDRGYGRCNQWHGTWAPTLGMHLDRLIGATAASVITAENWLGESSRQAVAGCSPAWSALLVQAALSVLGRPFRQVNRHVLLGRDWGAP